MANFQNAVVPVDILVTDFRLLYKVPGTDYRYWLVTQPVTGIPTVQSNASDGF